MMLGMKGRKRLAREPIHLQRPLQTLTVHGLQAVGSGRVYPGKLGMHRWPALLCRQRSNLGAHRFIRFRQRRQTFDQRLEIQNGASHQQRQTPSSMDRLNFSQRIRAKVCSGIRLVQVTEPQQPVRSRLQLVV